MCGISGYIGKSKNQSITHDLITRVFSRTESRGTDAAGFWGTSSCGKIFYYKEPVRSSALVKMGVWRQLKSQSLDLLLVHARAASQGEPQINKNNHPFISANKETSLIHNGRIPEFDSLKQMFQVISDCDSEVLLRIIEAGDFYNENDVFKEFAELPIKIGRRMMGIRDVFSLITQGHMAVAVGQRSQAERNLWLFRNQFRSLWVIDLRESLGQVFFCSTPDIWQDALLNCGFNLKEQKLIELPPEEVWHFSANDERPANVSRYKVCKENIKSILEKATRFNVQELDKKAMLRNRRKRLKDKLLL